MISLSECADGDPDALVGGHPEPLAFLALALLVQAVTRYLPALSHFGRYTGRPTVGFLAVAVLAIALNGFGKETGWRGFAVPALLPRFGPLGAALVIALSF